MPPTPPVPELIFYSNVDYKQWQVLIDNYEKDFAIWQEAVDAIEQRNAEQQAQWQFMHDKWEAIPLPRVSDDEHNTPIREPEPPILEELPSEPTEPPPPEMRYTRRPAKSGETIETEHGPVFVKAPSFIITPTSGYEFAMDPQDFNRAYTRLQTTAIPHPKGG